MYSWSGGIAYSFDETVHLSVLVFRVRSPDGESAPCSSLAELLERESQSEVFVEGISCSLSKVAEHGLVDAAEILLRYGAELNFEGKLSRKLIVHNKMAHT